MIEKNHHPDFDNHALYFKKEIARASHQASSDLFLRVQEEVGEILIKHVGNVDSRPFKKILATLVSNEQKRIEVMCLTFVCLENSLV